MTDGVSNAFDENKNRKMKKMEACGSQSEENRNGSMVSKDRNGTEVAVEMNRDTNLSVDKSGNGDDMADEMTA